MYLCTYVSECVRTPFRQQPLIGQEARLVDLGVVVTILCLDLQIMQVGADCDVIATSNLGNCIKLWKIESPSQHCLQRMMLAAQPFQEGSTLPR